MSIVIQSIYVKYISAYFHIELTNLKPFIVDDIEDEKQPNVIDIARSKFLFKELDHTVTPLENRETNDVGEGTSKFPWTNQRRLAISESGFETRTLHMSSVPRDQLPGVDTNVSVILQNIPVNIDVETHKLGPRFVFTSRGL